MVVADGSRVCGVGHQRFVACGDAVQRLWLAETAKERAEIQVRLEKADVDYGTNPMARRRLEWQIEQSEDSKAKGQKRRGVPNPAPMPEPDSDPRLKLVQ